MSWMLVSKLCDYVTLCCKRGFADVITLKILKWRYYLDHPGGPNAITRVLKRGSLGGQSLRKFGEDGSRGQNGIAPPGKKCRQPLEVGKGKGMDSFPDTPEGTGTKPYPPGLMF